MKLNQEQNGFSLVEVLAVVGIIGILASISVPRLLSSRRAANEGSATSSMRTIHTLESSHHSTCGQVKVANHPKPISTNTFSTIKIGYEFVINPSGVGLRPESYFEPAIPYVTGIAQTGSRRFGVCEDGVFRGDGSKTGFAN